MAFLIHWLSGGWKSHLGEPYWNKSISSLSFNFNSLEKPFRWAVLKRLSISFRISLVSLPLEKPFRWAVLKLAAWFVYVSKIFFCWKSHLGEPYWNLWIPKWTSSTYLQSWKSHLGEPYWNPLTVQYFLVVRALLEKPFRWAVLKPVLPLLLTLLHRVLEKPFRWAVLKPIPTSSHIRTPPSVGKAI